VIFQVRYVVDNMLLLILTVNTEGKRKTLKENYIQEQNGMSSWQSFFNQLSRPQRNNMHPTSEFICHCEKGDLIRNLNMEYIHTGKCSPNCFCAIIEIDKCNARRFNNSISIAQTDTTYCDKNIESNKSTLEQILDNQDSSLCSD
jgi:hypothetical protein